MILFGTQAVYDKPWPFFARDQISDFISARINIQYILIWFPKRLRNNYFSFIIVTCKTGSSLKNSVLACIINTFQERCNEMF